MNCQYLSIRVCPATRILIIVRAVAKYGVQYGMHNSFLGHNAAFCARRYHCKFFDVSGSNANIQRVVKSYVDNLTDADMYHWSRFRIDLIERKGFSIVE